jgi:hypothetical protein
MALFERARSRCDGCQREIAAQGGDHGLALGATGTR